jgi:hypothetical protein
MGVSYSSGYNNSIVLTSELFSEEFSKVSYVFMMIAYSMLGIFYPTLSYLTKDNWRLLHAIPMMCCLFLSVFIFKINVERGKQSKQSEV